MFKLYFIFNLVCIYLAIKSAFSAEVPDPNEQKVNNYLSSSSDDDVGKRASAMWFGPRLGKRTISPELRDDLLEELDGSPMFYQGEAPQRLAADIAQGSPYLVLVVTTAAGGRAVKPQPPVFYHSTTPRLGRRDASAQDIHSRPPFAPRLGRNLPFSPRLGRSFGFGQTVDSFGF